MRRHTVDLSLLLARKVAQQHHKGVTAPLASHFYNSSSTKRWSSSNNSNDNHKTTSSSSNSNETVIDAEEWIRPDRPLVGDKGHSHLMFQDDEMKATAPGQEDPSMVEGEYYEDEEMELARIEKELEELERLEKEQLAAAAASKTALSTVSSSSQQQQSSPQEQPTVDWLKTRRTVFGDQVVASKDETKKKQLRGEFGLPVVLHTLLSVTEISSVLTSMGGSQITLLSNAHGRMGVGLDGMLVVTATTSYQIRSMAVALIRQLRLRKLGDCGVQGANMGTKRRSFSSDQTWLIVDCGNYEVHIMSPQAREYYQLERLWGEASDDPVLSLDCTDEEAVDRYLDADHKEQQLKAKSNKNATLQHGFINSISNKNSTSWKEMYAKLQNVPKRKDVVVPITNPPQRRKKNNMNRWR